MIIARLLLALSLLATQATESWAQAWRPSASPGFRAGLQTGAPSIFQFLTPPSGLPAYIKIPAGSLNRYRAASSATRAGTADTMAGAVGDSTTRGFVASFTDGSAYGSSWVHKLPSYITGADPSLAVSAEGVCGHGNLTATAAGTNQIGQYDGRFAGAYRTGLPTVGGNHFLFNAGDTLNYTPNNTWDRAQIWYVRNSGIGTFTYAVDGGATTAVNGNATPAAVVSVTASAASVGTHTLNLVGSTSGDYISCIDVWQSTRKQLRFRNMGSSSSLTTSANWTGNTNVYDGRPTLRAMNFHIVTIGLGINDMVAGTAIATYKTNLQTLVTDIQSAGGDVILMTSNPISTGTVSQAVQDSYNQAVRDLAAQLGVALFDTALYFGAYDRGLGGDRGLYSDDKHPSKLGYQFWAQGIAPMYTMQ